MDGEALRYDAAIIGAGAEGLAAAVTLARSGLKVVVIERNEQPGGRHVTREFHPGFRASPFCDECSIPPRTFWHLDLARHGVLLQPSAPSTALWADRAVTDGASRSERAAITSAALERAAKDAAPLRRSLFGGITASPVASWPGEELAGMSLSEALGASQRGADQVALGLFAGLEGRAAHPDRSGTALHVLAGAGALRVIGGLQSVTDALANAAQGLGVEMLFGLEAMDIHRKGRRPGGVRLADGSEVAARAVISTLDFKRTFLSLFSWNDLPAALATRAAQFRTSGATARLLVALDSVPKRPSFAGERLFAGPVHIAPQAADMGKAFAAWQAGTLAEQLPVALRIPSATDPRLSPVGAATMTVTVGCVPSHLFDGAWTHEKRDALRDRVLGGMERVLPGVTERILACELLVPPDIEQALGCTDGDLWGGEIAADQMFSFRPGGGCIAPRTPIEGLYLAGPSTSSGVIATCASGIMAAQALIADLKEGRLK